VGLQSSDRSDKLQPATNSPLGVILVSLRVTKVDQDPVAHVFRNETAEALHRLCNALLVSRNDLAEVFRVHAG
jgi:hypothetical protein